MSIKRPINLIFLNTIIAAILVSMAFFMQPNIIDVVPNQQGLRFTVIGLLIIFVTIPILVIELVAVNVYHILKESRYHT